MCLSHPFQSQTKSLKHKILLKKVVRYNLRVTKILNHPAVLGEAKPSYIYLILKPQFRVSSPPQSQTQAVVYVSTPRKYPRSGYFLVSNNDENCIFTLELIFISLVSFSLPPIDFYMKSCIINMYLVNVRKTKVKIPDSTLQ